MALVVPDVGEVAKFNILLRQDPVENLILRLYGSDTTPAESDTAATYTEISGGGYGPVTLTPTDWTITPGDPTQADYPVVTFTFTAAVGNVYGYFITQDVSGTLMWAERFNSAPINIQNSGDEIKVTPRITVD